MFAVFSFTPFIVYIADYISCASCCFHSCAVFRTILKKHNLAAGDFPDLQAFASKLNEVKFSEFHSFSQKQIDELDHVLNKDIPDLMAVRFYFCSFEGGCSVRSCCLTSFVCLASTGASQRTRLARVLACQNGRQCKHCRPYAHHSWQIWQERLNERK